jgi:site-specific DNA-adenine methylase
MEKPKQMKKPKQIKGLPYQGSKVKISSILVDKMLELNPQATTFVDVFGGGGSMSLRALDKGLKVHYNELNGHVFELVKHLKEKGFTDDMLPCLTRNEFLSLIKQEPSYLTGLAMLVYSFSNNQKDYLYARTKEAEKQAIHNAIITGDFSKLGDYNPQELEYAKYSHLPLRQRFQIFKKIFKDIFEGVDRVQSINSLLNIQDFASSFNKDTRLVSVERLSCVQEFEATKLNISNLCYSQVDYNSFDKETTIFYFDPPYINTRGYTNEFEFQKFNLFLQDLKLRGFNIFVSEYTNYFGFVEVLSVKKNVTVCATSNSIYKQELLLTPYMQPANI